MSTTPPFPRDPEPERPVPPAIASEPMAVDARPATFAIGALLLLSLVLFVLVPFLAADRGVEPRLLPPPVSSETRSREVAIARETLLNGHLPLATDTLIELWEDPRILGPDRDEVRRLLMVALEETLADTTALEVARRPGYRNLLRDLRPAGGG